MDSSEKSLTEFWILVIRSYSKVTKKVFRALIPFVSIYLCESAFSTFLQIKSKQRNQLDVENDKCCALSNMNLLIMNLVRKIQFQISHKIYFNHNI